MKKNILGIVALLALAFAPQYASAQSPENNSATETVCPVSQNSCKGKASCVKYKGPDCKLKKDMRGCNMSALNLSDKQKDQVKEIMQKERKAMKDASKKYRAETAKEMKKVLSPEQFAKWENMQKAKFDKRKSKAGKFDKRDNRRHHRNFSGTYNGKAKK